MPPPPALEPTSRAASGRPPGRHDDRLGDVTAFLQNRLILLGLGAVIVLLLLTIVLVVVGDGGGGGGTPSIVQPNTPSSDAFTQPRNCELGG